MKALLPPSAKVLILFVILWQFACTNTDLEDNHSSDDGHWSYAGSTGPENWASLEASFHTCKDGTAQSPININTDDLQQQESRTNFQLVDTVILHSVTNNGHSIQSTSQESLSIIIDGQSTEFKQLHFHAASEHAINNEKFPLEIHLVHQTDNLDLVVFSVLAKQGQTHDGLAQILDSISPNQDDSDDSVVSMNPYKSFLPDSLSFYTYEGSLTTPPCTEGVSWFVFATPIEVSAEQIEQFRTFYDNNARPIQAGNQRTVFYQDINHGNAN